MSRQSLIKSRLQLNSAGVQMEWHVCYYDNFGDMFDVANMNNQYTMNRNDLVDFFNVNTNIFELTTESHQQQQQAANTIESNSGTSTTFNGNSAIGSLNLEAGDSFDSEKQEPLSIVANSAENSFILRTIERGVFIIELTPISTTRRDFSRDYIGLVISDTSGDFDTIPPGNQLDSIGGRSRIEANLGDIICLNRQLDSYYDQSANGSDYVFIY